MEEYIFENIILMLNYNIRMLYKKHYPEIYQNDFEELEECEEKQILFNLICSTLTKTPYDTEIYVISVVIYYYLTNILECNFEYDLMYFLRMSKHKKNQIQKIILTIASVEDQPWASEIRKFSNNLP